MKTQEIIDEIKQVKERLTVLENQLKESEVKEEYKYVPWIPENDNGEYWFIDSDGKILSDRKDNLNSFFIGRLNYHNVFKTKELAEKRKLLGPLERKLAFILDQLGRDENEIDFNDGNISKYSFYYNSNINNIVIITWNQHQDRHKSQYATSREIMEKAIKLMGDDAYRYCGVEPPVKGMNI